MTLAIYTPTYNRVEKLQKLYNSIVNQTYKDFFWLVIDDGSTDNTYEKIKEWQQSSIIEIRYIKKENGGKHSAINKALDIVDNYWNICIDSDDWLISKDSLKKLKQDIDMFDHKKNIVSIVYPLQLSGKKIRGKVHKPKLLRSYDSKIRMMNITETTIASRPNSYRDIRFPIFENEKFISEDGIEILKIEGRQRLYINYPLVEGQYLNDGLSNNIINHWRKSPKGYYYVRNILADYYKKNGKYFRLLKPLGQMVAFNLDSKRKPLSEINYKVFGFFSIPLGILYWIKKFKKK